MISPAAQTPPNMPWHAFMRTYAAASSMLHLLWELAQMPLYTLWRDGSFAKILYAAIHCTIGDVMIALLALLCSVLLVGNAQWPHERYTSVAVGAVVLGIVYTVYSEWLNVFVQKTWTYSEAMPVVFGLGLSPLLQWFIIPPVLLAALRRT